MYEKVLKPLFFLMTPERAHYTAMGMLRFAVRIPGMEFLLKRYFNSSAENGAVEVCGLKFQNRVGLAAGFDKDARWLRELNVLGLGMWRLNAAAKPQAGNPNPDFSDFRLWSDQ